MPRVVRFNVTPVKSTALHHPDAIRLEPFGVAGNRQFFFVDGDGRRLSGLTKTPLLPIRAEHDAGRERLTLRLPNGEVIEDDATPSGEALVVDFYGRPVAAHALDGVFTEVLTRYAGQEMRLARADEPGAGTDVEPVTMVSLESVDELRRQGGREEALDPGRFRMLIEIEGCRPHEEDAWEGLRVRVGEAEVEVGRQVPRCALTTVDPTTAQRDFPTLSVIKRYRGTTPTGKLPFGVYARVTVPGTIRAGDAVEPIA